MFMFKVYFYKLELIFAQSVRRQGCLITIISNITQNISLNLQVQVGPPWSNCPGLDQSQTREFAREVNEDPRALGPAPLLTPAGSSAAGTLLSTWLPYWPLGFSGLATSMILLP